MGPAAPVIVGLVAGAVVSKVIGKITGSELLGALAGGFVGMGFGIDASGALKWSNPAAGLFGGAEAAGGTLAGDVIAGGSDLLLGADPLNMAGSFEGLAGAESIAGGLGAEVGGNTLQLGYMGEGAGPTLAGGASSVAGPANPLNLDISASGLTPAAETGGFLSRAGSFIENNPRLSEIAFRGIQSAMSPDAEDLMRLKAELEQKSREAVDPDALKDKLKQMNQGLLSAGYQPAATTVRSTGFTPNYMTRIDPNYKAMLDKIYGRTTEA